MLYMVICMVTACDDATMLPRTHEYPASAAAHIGILRTAILHAFYAPIMRCWLLDASCIARNLQSANNPVGDFVMSA